jgi:hypothetical protein
MERTGSYCPSCDSFDQNAGYVEFGGLCAAHWVELDEDERDSIRSATSGAASEPRPIIHQHHEHHHPPQSRLVTFAVALVGGAIGAVAVLVAYLSHFSK